MNQAGGPISGRSRVANPRPRTARTARRALGSGVLVSAALPVALLASLPARSAPAATRAVAHETPAMLQLRTLAGHGTVLVDEKGVSLYGLSSERNGRIACKGGCLGYWPPLTVPASTTAVPVAGGIAGAVGFVKRSATTKQVTYNGYPLYYFVQDSKAGEANGEGVKSFGGVWELVDPAASSATASLLSKSAKGTAAKGAAAAAILQVAKIAGHGSVLVDAKGDSLYGLSSEKGGKLACKGACLTYWPPLTVAPSTSAVSIGTGIAGSVGLVQRSASMRQVTYNGYPVYRFAQDTKSGQAHGEGIKAFGGIWELLDPAPSSAKGSLLGKGATGAAARTASATTSGGGSSAAW